MFPLRRWWEHCCIPLWKHLLSRHLLHIAHVSISQIHNPIYLWVCLKDLNSQLLCSPSYKPRTYPRANVLLMKHLKEKRSTQHIQTSKRSLVRFSWGTWTVIREEAKYHHRLKVQQVHFHPERRSTVTCPKFNSRCKSVACIYSVLEEGLLVREFKYVDENTVICHS